MSICVKFICMEQLRIYLRRGPSPVTSCRDILRKVDLQNLTNIADIAILCNTHRQLQASLLPKIIIEVEVLKVNTGIIWHHIGISLILAISFQHFQHIPLSPKKPTKIQLQRCILCQVAASEQMQKILRLSRFARTRRAGSCRVHGINLQKPWRAAHHGY